MFDRLAEIEQKYMDLADQVNDPEIIANQSQWRKLMKEYSDMTPIVEAYREYEKVKASIAEELELLEDKLDDDFRELVKEELAENKERLEELQKEITILLIPKDPNDERMLLWKSAAAQAVTKRHFLRQTCSVCIPVMQKEENGKSKS